MFCAVDDESIVFVDAAAAEEWDVKKAVAQIANQELRLDWKVGILSKGQFKMIAREVAHEIAKKRKFGEPLAHSFESFESDVAERLHHKKHRLLLFSVTLKEVMRNLPPVDEVYNPLQRVFLHVEEEQLTKEARARAIVDVHFDNRKPFLKHLRCGIIGGWSLSPNRLVKEMRIFEQCIVVRRNAWAQGHVRGRDLECIITEEAIAGRTKVNAAMHAEFKRRVMHWWSMHKDKMSDDTDDSEWDGDLDDAAGPEPMPWAWRSPLP